MRLLWALLFFYLITYTNCQTINSYPSANQDKTVKRLITYVSNWLTSAQMYTACNTVSSGVIQQTSFSTLKTTLTTNLMASLSTSQYATVLSKGTSLIFTLGPTGITSAISKASTVIGNNLQPFYNQMLGYGKTLTTQGLQPKGVAKNCYRITNSFASKKRIKTIYTRVSLQFTSSQWKAIVSALNGILQFTKNGF